MARATLAAIAIAWGRPPSGEVTSRERSAAQTAAALRAAAGQDTDARPAQFPPASTNTAVVSMTQRTM